MLYLLSYAPVVWMERFELPWSCSQSECLTRLGYIQLVRGRGFEPRLQTVAYEALRLTNATPCETLWCSGGDSNPHGIKPTRFLRPARLPIPPPELGGNEGTRTPNPLLARQVLSQLSYAPKNKEGSMDWDQMDAVGAPGTESQPLRSVARIY